MILPCSTEHFPLDSILLVSMVLWSWRILIVWRILLPMHGPLPVIWILVIETTMPSVHRIRNMVERVFERSKGRDAKILRIVLWCLEGPVIISLLVHVDSRPDTIPEKLTSAHLVFCIAIFWASDEKFCLINDRTFPTYPVISIILFQKVREIIKKFEITLLQIRRSSIPKPSTKNWYHHHLSCCFYLMECVCAGVRYAWREE